MKSSYKRLGDYICPVDVRNTNLEIVNLQGVSIAKEFVPSIANIIGTDLSTYRIVRTGQFAYGPVTSRNGDKISIALLKGDDCIISSSYLPFEVYKKDELLPEYLILWFKRPEFDRYARFMSNGSAREVFDWDCMCGVEIPVPSIDEQRKIVHAYQVINERISLLGKINDKLTEQCSMGYLKMLNGYTTENETLPPLWKVGSIGDYCDLKSGYAFKSEWWTDEGYKVIKIANINNNSIELDECDCVLPENATKASNFLVKSGDILIAMTGATTGKIGLVPLTNEIVVVNQRVGKFFLGDNPLERVPFLYSTLLYNRVLCHLQPDGTAGSAQDNLSADNIKDIAIVVPDSHTIKEFNRTHSAHIKEIISNNAEIRCLKQLSTIVLQTISSQ